NAALESFGSTELAQVANTYSLFPVGGSSGPQIRYAGAVVTAGQFGAWTAIGAEAIAGGCEVAWRLGSSDQYTVWNTDTNGNLVSMPIGVVSGDSWALEGLEFSFQQDLNHDSTVGVVATIIESQGATSLVHVADRYALGIASGPQVGYAGAAVTTGQFGAWTAIGAEAIAGGCEVAWQLGSSDQYTVWNTDSTGNMRSEERRVGTGGSWALEGLEFSFQQDLNHDSTVGVVATIIESQGATSLVHVADRYALGIASGPQVGYAGAAVTTGQFGAWTAIGAEAIAGGCEVAWQLGSSDQYTVWNTDSTGNM